MRRIVGGLLGAAIACASVTDPAAAADMPPYQYPLAPPPSFYNWTGFYVGGQGGYGYGSIDVNPHGSNIHGWFGGGQIGFNWQAERSPWVLGVELDAAFGSINRAIGAINGYPFASAYNKVDSFGTARVRVGYAIDRAMIYGTGGVAWAHNDLSLYADPDFLTLITSSANTHVGYSVGVGFEWALSRRWTMKLEYLYNGLGSANYLSAAVPGGVNADLSFGTGRLGFNYIFDWGRPYFGEKF